MHENLSAHKTSVLAVVGPTASGKTALAIALAERLDTEIVSADSMQFYRGMEIGTAAPTPEERARVNHHFVGFLNPSETFSAGQFQDQARAVVADLNNQGKPAVVVGGSGLYISALIDGLFPGPGRDDSIRKQLHEEAESISVEAMYERLQRIDPDYAHSIHARDLRRIVRALEVYALTGEPLSRLHAMHRAETPSLDAVQFALSLPREQLYARIDARVDAMVQNGFIEEVKTLLEAGYGAHLDRLRSLGYREMAAYVRGDIALEETIAQIKQNTRRYAKRQLTWFRADPRIHWMPVSAEQTCEQQIEHALELLAAGPSTAIKPPHIGGTGREKDR